MCFFVDVSKVSFSVFQLSHLGGYVHSHQPSHLKLVLFKAVQFKKQGQYYFLIGVYHIGFLLIIQIDCLVLFILTYIK